LEVQFDEYRSSYLSFKKNHEDLRRKLSDRLSRQHGLMESLKSHYKIHPLQNRLISFVFRKILAFKIGMKTYCTYCGDNPYALQCTFPNKTIKAEYKKEREAVYELSRSILRKAIRLQKKISKKNLHMFYRHHPYYQLITH
jgi:hypothetical protein